MRRSFFNLFFIMLTMGATGCSGSSPSLTQPPANVPLVDTSLPHDEARASADRVANSIAESANFFVASHFSVGSTRGLYGASTGSECVAAVQAILMQASLPFVGAVDNNGTPVVNVDRFRAAIAADTAHWVRIPQKNVAKQAAPGDIWIQGDGAAGKHAGQNHVGICQDWSCRHIVSNSSQHGSFTWSGTPQGYAEYYHEHGFPYIVGAVYHHR